jgi:hypothetical protein
MQTDRMTDPSPAALMRRLADCPADFLAEPRIAATGAVHVAAVVSDLLVALGGAGLRPDQVGPFTSTDARQDRNRLRLVLIAAWLLYDEAFRGRGLASRALAFLTGDVAGLAPFAPAERWVQDPDRREELARRSLHALGLQPAGESAAQAEDRLATLDSAGRQQVIGAARKAEERARQVRAAMAAEAARQASLKAMRE